MQQGARDRNARGRKHYLLTTFLHYGSNGPACVRRSLCRALHATAPAVQGVPTLMSQSSDPVMTRRPDLSYVQQYTAARCPRMLPKCRSCFVMSAVALPMALGPGRKPSCRNNSCWGTAACAPVDRFGGYHAQMNLPRVKLRRAASPRIGLAGKGTPGCQVAGKAASGKCIAFYHPMHLWGMGVGGLKQDLICMHIWAGTHARQSVREPCPEQSMTMHMPAAVHVRIKAHIHLAMRWPVPGRLRWFHEAQQAVPPWSQQALGHLHCLPATRGRNKQTHTGRSKMLCVDHAHQSRCAMVQRSRDTRMRTHTRTHTQSQTPCCSRSSTAADAMTQRNGILCRSWGSSGVQEASYVHMLLSPPPPPPPGHLRWRRQLIARAAPSQQQLPQELRQRIRGQLRLRGTEHRERAGMDVACGSRRRNGEVAKPRFFRAIGAHKLMTRPRLSQVGNRG